VLGWGIGARAGRPGGRPGGRALSSHAPSGCCLRIHSLIHIVARSSVIVAPAAPWSASQSANSLPGTLMCERTCRNSYYRDRTRDPHHVLSRGSCSLHTCPKARAGKASLVGRALLRLTLSVALLLHAPCGSRDSRGVGIAIEVVVVRGAWVVGRGVRARRRRGVRVGLGCRLVVRRMHHLLMSRFLVSVCRRVLLICAVAV